MSRSGYTDDCEYDWQPIMWRGQVASSIRGKRGQAFLRELLQALDEMPDKKLIAHDLVEVRDGAPILSNVCAIGAVGVKRGADLTRLDPYDYGAIAATFGIARQLVQEIEWVNDEGHYYKDSPQSRWCRVRAWVRAQIKGEV